MAHPERAVEGQAVDHCEHVVGEAVPVEGPGDRHGRVAVAPQVDRPSAEPVEMAGQGLPHESVKPGRMGQEDVDAGPSEVVDLELDAVG